MLQKNLYFLVSLIFLSLTILHAETLPEILRIMPLGDSITYDNTHDDDVHPRPVQSRIGYRGPLWSMLNDANVSFDFVGPKMAGQKYAPNFDPDNAGYPGQTSRQIADKTYPLLENYNPNIILLHIGTNDNSKSVKYVNQILDWVDTYENDTNQIVRVIVALILDRKVHDLDIEEFNHNLKKLITKRLKNGDQLTLVDMYRGAGLNDSDYLDRTHPNTKGYKKMARVWYKALITPYTPELHIFPHTLVKSSLIQSLHINESTHSVTFVTKVPTSGIIF